MRRLVVFENVSLDGYFTDRNNDMSWAKDGGDEELDAFAAENATGGGVLVFGRVTYEMMASFWQTPQARELQPVVAERMNALPKVVISRTLERPTWRNTTRLQGDLVRQIRKMKSEPGDGMAILGSGSVVSQLASEGLVDEYQIVVSPIALGGGRTLFDGMKERLRLRLTRSRTFRNGKVFLSYEPAR
jgi:dihydrofolate reductase